jgi:hypothetical protein
MKKVFLAAAIVCSIASFSLLNEQPLENTKWQGSVNVPAPIEAVFEFKKDTFLLYIDGQVFETMLYKVSADTLRVEKLDGNSPCNNEAALYNFSIKENKLYLKATNDPCSVRASAFGEFYTKL